MAGLSTAAWIGHDLGLAAGVGGTLFGKVALHPATRNINDARERGRVVNDAWRTFNTYQLAGLGLMAVSWFAGRSKLSGGEVDSTSRTLTLVKDALVLATFGTAIANGIAGRRMAAHSPGGATPISSDGESLAADAPAEARRLKPLIDTLGMVNLLCGAGVIGVTAVLAMRAGKSARWSAVSRLLP